MSPASLNRLSLNRVSAPAALEVADENLEEMLDSLSGADNYLHLILALLRPHLHGPILEVGAGHGDLTAAFAELGRVHATDISDRCLSRLRERFADDARVTVGGLDVTRPVADQSTSTSLVSGSFGSAVLVNVLEHLPDDVAALCCLGDLVRPGGNVVIFVPAFEALYGRFDRLIGHYRRYRKSSLDAAFTSAGLDTVELRYVNLPGWFTWLLAVRMMRIVPSSGLLVTAYDRLVIPTVSAVETRVPMPFGQSLVGIARVRGSVT